MANAQVDTQFIPNNRGGRSLVYQGYKYRVKRTRGTSIHWKCCISTCPATINTSNDYITTVNNIHNHGPNHSKIAFDKFYSSVKDMVKEDSRSIHSIYLSGLHEMRRDEAEVVAEAPTFYSVHYSVPLLRLCDIDEVWLHALEEVDMTDPAILQFADYMTETWVEAPGRAMWNHFNNDGARTTNHVEGWHSKLNKSGPCHPNLFKFISLIQKEQSCNEIVMCQLAAGGRQPPRKKKYRELDQRLRREKDYLLAGTKTPTEYADSVSHLVGL